MNWGNITKQQVPTGETEPTDYTLNAIHRCCHIFLLRVVPVEQRWRRLAAVGSRQLGGHRAY